MDRVVVWNRTDGGTGKRLDGFRVLLLDDKRQTLWKSDPTPAPDKDKTFATSGPVAVTFTTALADYEQSGFTATSILKPKSKSSRAGLSAEPPTSRTISPCSPPLRS